MLTGLNVKVLIIEDDSAFQHFIQILLTQIGIKHKWHAGTYEQGIELYTLIKPDLLIVDINLGKNQKSGVDCVKTIREKDQNIPVIYITSYYDDTYYKECRSTRPSSFMNKELSTLKLKQAIDHALQYQIDLHCT